MLSALLPAGRSSSLEGEEEEEDEEEDEEGIGG